MEKVSVITAVYNEQENIVPLVKAIEEVFSKSGYDYEIIVVDDGSTDSTLGEVLGSEVSHLVCIELSRNYGQTAALKAGIDIAEGEYIGTLDGDLQNDPADLPDMISVLKEKNCDFVTGIRSKRKDRFILRRLPSLIANGIIRKVSGTDIRDNGCGTKVFRASVIKELPLYGERHRFLPTIAVLEGARVEQVAVRHHPRIHGKSKYGIGRTMKVVSDLMLLRFSRKFRQKPMYLFGPVGVVTALAGMVILVYLLIEKLLGSDIWGRPIMLLGILFVLFGFQFISTGLLIDAVVRDSYESGSAKPYKIRKIVRS